MHRKNRERIDGIRVFIVVSLAIVSGLVIPASPARADLVTVGNPGNAADTNGFGAVSYAFRISDTEVSINQYTAFLNAVAANDTNALYDTRMAPSLFGITYGGIHQFGFPGNFNYVVVAGRGDNPVNYVSFYDALRYANWLHNGMPTGGQDNTTTEDGAYTITAAGISANSITRNVGASFFLPSEDEWYKAAYYDPTTTSYFVYATSSNTVPTAEAPPGGSNSANYGSPAGNTTAVGAYTSSLSPYGTFDQSGNVFEWNEAIASGRGFRGGSWGNGAIRLPSSFRGFANPEGSSDSFGFRVAGSIPEPVPGSTRRGSWVLAGALLVTLTVILLGWDAASARGWK